MQLDQSFARSFAITAGSHLASGTHEESDGTRATAQYDTGTP